MLKKDINYKILLGIGIMLIIVRLIFAKSQMICILPGSAPIDDDLYFKWANSIVEGNWLGDYDYLTLSKYPLFAVYLAALHKIGISYITGNCLLWIFICGICLWAFRPVIKKNISRLIFFTFMLYNPYSYNNTTLRVYRDTLFYMLCIMFFASMAGWALRLKKDVKNNMGFLVVAGIGMAGSWTIREDGYWLLPFYIVAVVICFLYIITDKELKNKSLRCICAGIPAVVTLMAVMTICSINYSYYGVFTLTDFNGGSFARCFGAMTTIPHENWKPMVSVPKDVREKLYLNCPSIAEFEYYLEDNTSAIKKSYFHNETGDYKSGSFYWAIRRRANEMGVYESRTKAKAFWRQAADEVEAYAKKLPDSLSMRSSLTPPIKSEYVVPVTHTALDSIIFVNLWKDMGPYRTYLSDITTGQIEIWEEFLGDRSNYSAIEYTFDPYHTPFQSFCYRIMDIIIWLYRIATVVLLPLAVVSVVKGFVEFKKYDWKNQILLFIILGLMAMSLFRMFIIAYMDVTAFGLGHYTMYLAVCYPILTMICGIAPKFIKTK